MQRIGVFNSPRLGLIVLIGTCLIVAGCRGLNSERTPSPAPIPIVITPTTPSAPATPAPSTVGTSVPTPAGTTVPWSFGAETEPRLIGTYVPPLEAPDRCAEMAQYGARFTWVAIPWEGIEPIPGIFNWRRADQILNGLHDCGFDIGVHVLSRHPLLAQPVPDIPSKQIASMPPRDMNAYYRFVNELAKRYKGVISRYSIENEAHASSNWPASPEEYFALLATAYRAVHDADPNALVEDSAISSSGLGVLIAHDMVQAGKKQEAIDFLRRYYAVYGPKSGGGEPIVVENAEQLDSLFAHPEVQRLFTWAPMLFANHQSYDVQQLHYFGPWQDLPMVMNWVHQNLQQHGTDKPIDLWEMGYGWTNVETYDPEAHARDEPKYLAVAIGEGGLRALSWLFTDFAFEAEGHPGLVTADGPRPAAQSFAVTARFLNGTTRTERLNLGPGIWGYRFDRPEGSVYVLWSDEPKTVSLSSASAATVTDMTNQTIEADPKALELSTSPIFVELE